MYLRALCSIALLILAGCAKEQPLRIEADPMSPQAMIFFDFDSAEINQPGFQRALEQFASDEKKSRGGGRIFICGHSDRAGSTQAKLAISKRRAEAVRDALVGLGIPADQIVVRGFGDRDLLVPTPDGVREAQNRRVIVGLEHPLGLGGGGCTPF